MYFLKKVLLGLGLLVLIYGGSTGTQSSSLFVQGMSFIGLLIVFIILFVFARMLIRGLGCLPSLLIMLCVGLFMMYTLGLFNNGIGGLSSSISQFIGRETTQTQQNPDLNDEPQEEQDQMAGELFEDIKPQSADTQPAQSNSQPQKKQGLIQNVVLALTGNSAQQQPQEFNPNNYPVIYAYPRVLTGDMLEIRGRYFKLFGIAAPEISQTCANAKGQTYNCGKQAAAWLKSWIEDGELECRVIQQDTRGNMVGTCSFGPYDLGAAIVNAGWALAYTKYTDIYVPYELQAQQNRRGLWQGQFYKPWDWHKIKERSNNVKVIRQKKKKPGIFG